jgi:NinB protein
MAEHLAIQLFNPVQAHKAMTAQLWPQIKALTTAGQRLILTLVDAEDAKSAKQRRYYHGVILTEIANKASINGQKFPMKVWKEHFRKTYLPDKRKVYTNPITGKKSKRSVRQSTEGLSVKKYAQLIEMVTAFAVTELGVEFSERNFDRWVDPETGEILQ